MNDSITKEVFYAHPIHDVWSAITNADEISSWFLKADFKAEVGYDYTFTHEEIKDDGACLSTVVKGKVLEVNPVNQLTYTWIVDDKTVTTVHWHLTEKEAGTQLVLKHTGISNYGAADIATKMFESFSGGWENCMNGLQTYLKSRVHV